MARILLIVGGGIAAFKAAELIRVARRHGHKVTPVLTNGGAHFVTPMTLAALAESPVYTSLWDLKDETEMGHIQLSRAADLVLVCPATADLLAKMAAGIADDLATTLLLATDKPVFAAPAMNVRMWSHEATRANVATLRARGVTVIEPDEGEMACGEYGPGRLPEVAAILANLGLTSGPFVPSVPRLRSGLTDSHSPFVPSVPRLSSGLTDSPSPFVPSEVEAPLAPGPSPSLGTNADLTGTHILVTAGPTHEPIDPVRVIANRSSGRQGFAIAAAAAQAGARVTLIAGPVALPTPAGVARIDVETAEQMRAAVEHSLPCDVAILVAAVADWKVAPSATKLKKSAGPPRLEFSPNPDILADLGRHPLRPRLLVGFAAETDDLLRNAAAKRSAKRADWIVANDVSGDVMGGLSNHLHLVAEAGVEDLGSGPKEALARILVARIATALKDR